MGEVRGKLHTGLHHTNMQVHIHFRDLLLDALLFPQSSTSTSSSNLAYGSGSSSSNRPGGIRVVFEDEEEVEEATRTGEEFTHDTFTRIITRQGC
jgi:hypothetical protein